MAFSNKKNKTNDKPLKFDKKLVLNQWIISLFEVDCLEKLADGMAKPEYEGFDEQNISRFYRFFKMRLFEWPQLPWDVLLEYDQNIVRHWKQITAARNLSGNTLYPKYFQYLSLLFMEIYLDRYFTDSDRLLADLNEHLSEFNQDKHKRDRVEPFRKEDLNKLALWNATGSGKTLLMHINILQYQHYLKRSGRRRELNRIILLTPNEGLSNQHLEEFALSGIDAELFSEGNRGLFTGYAVQIIDIHKLREEKGEKTFAIDAFEGNNLVLVDEGHRGASGKEWLDKRNKLCEQGFSFEYSATFGQAMKASGKKELEQLYAKCILFDYSYKYFYRDGYGKDYNILNLEDDSDESIRQRYLLACLVAFYQQQKLYLDQRKTFMPFLIEKPLWVFVGGSVKAVRTENKRKVSDVVDILLFLAGFVDQRKRRETISMLADFLRGQSHLQDQKGRDIFADIFTYIYNRNMSAEEMYRDILKVLFNADTPAAIHVEQLKGAEGEIALRIGDYEPFGLINVGDASDLCKLCARHSELVVSDREFSGSLFGAINEADSTVNILIGSKKFTEGWNSWRVSTMGLMNIGQSEGPQVIQLFGRGVRLRGYEFCLKRSKRNQRVKPPRHIELLETLNIFGIRANYMRQFKDYLEEEGLPPDGEYIHVTLPVIKNLGKKKLKTIKLKEGVDYKRQGPNPTLSFPDDHLQRTPIALDWYPKIQALASDGVENTSDEVKPQTGRLGERHIAFMNIDEIYFALQQYKNERCLYNLNLSRRNIIQLLTSPGWYTLFIPEDELRVERFDRVRRWQEIAIALLKKYCDRFYQHERARWENQHLEYGELTEDDPNFFDDYSFYLEESCRDIAEKLIEIKNMIESGSLRACEFKNLQVIDFANNLYTPLVYIKSSLVEVKPIVLETESERDFVFDLQTFCNSSNGFFEDKQLYLLRNMSRGHGIGFFEAANFYPDFILWLLTGDKQFISFVDPKGIRNLAGLNDPKIQFYSTIKDLEKRLDDPHVVLNSFIVSRTPYQQPAWWQDQYTKHDFEAHHVFFQEDRDNYIQKIFLSIASNIQAIA